VGLFSRKKTAKATASAAEQHNAQPTYKDLSHIPEEPVIKDEELAGELPVTHNALAGGIPKWEDALHELDAEAAIKIRRCLAVKKPVRKLAIRVSKLDWTVVGTKSEKKKEPKPTPGAQPPVAPRSPLAQQITPDIQLAASSDDNTSPDLDSGEAVEPVDPLDEIKPDLDDPKEAMKPSPDELGGTEGGGEASTQTRAEAIAEIWDQIPAKLEMFEHFVGSLLDGTRFQQIKTIRPDDPSNRSGGKWAVPDLYMGQRHRYNAGGDMEWDGANTLVQVERTTGEATRKTTRLPIDQFMVHRPGPGSNPEGDLDLGVAVYNAVVYPWNNAVTSTELWVRIFGVPATLMGANTKKARPDKVNSILTDRAKKMQMAMGEQGSVTALSNEELVNLLQADPNGLNGMVQYMQYKEALMDDVLTMAALTSSAGVSQANRTGDTSEQKDNEDEAAFAAGVQIAHTINKYLLPWILRKNPNIPPLAEGEEEVYLWPQDPQPDDEQDTDVDETAMPGTGEAPAGEPDLSAIDRILGGMDEAQDTENQAQVFEALQSRAATKRGMGGHASVALAAVSPLPPVH
jgi:hypothetical protein